MSVTPYYADDRVRLFLGDCREILPALGLRADVAIVDPPYGETSLAWDRWPDGWPEVVAEVAPQMWCFGSMRMFLDRRDEFAGWKLAQDVVWEKHAGSGFDDDRFKRVHEFVTHWYRGRWSDLYRDPQREPGMEPAGRTMNRRARPEHRGEIGGSTHYLDGTRLVRSVIHAKSMRGQALHPTQKPIEIISPLISYSCPPGGTVVDPCAGSGSVLAAARLLDLCADGVEADERYAEIAARRLSQADLFADSGEEVTA